MLFHFSQVSATNQLLKECDRLEREVALKQLPMLSEQEQEENVTVSHLNSLADDILAFIKQNAALPSGISFAAIQNAFDADENDIR